LASAEGLTLIVVEQNTRLALEISPRTVVLDRGRVVYDGPSAALKADPTKLEQLIGVVRR
jgi:branched-chain amino acid transport system ATP-binding protein